MKICIHPEPNTDSNFENESSEKSILNAHLSAISAFPENFKRISMVELALSTLISRSASE